MTENRWLIWALLTWIVAGVLLAFFERPLYDELWIIVGFLQLGFIFIGAILLLGVTVYGVQRRSLIAGTVALGFIISSLALWHTAPIITAKGDTAVFWYRFTRNRSAYDRIVAEVERAPAGGIYVEAEGIRYQVDMKDAIRIAFPQPGGLLDNWEGVIYDSTGIVLKAKGWTEAGEFSAPAAVRELFGGDIVSCQHIEGHYYRCWFT